MTSNMVTTRPVPSAAAADKMDPKDCQLIMAAFETASRSFG
jgi:hypothetical protein